MKPEADGSATPASTSWAKKLAPSWAKKLAPCVEEATVGTANWLGDLTGWTGDDFSDPDVVDTSGMVDFQNSPFCSPAQHAGPHAPPRTGETLLFELLRSSSDPGPHDDVTVCHEACLGSRGPNLQTLTLCRCCATDRPWKEVGMNVSAPASDRCVSGSAARTGDSILQLRHDVREAVRELALVVATTAGATHVAMHMPARHVLLPCTTGSKSALHPSTGSVKTDFERLVNEGGTPTVKESTDWTNVMPCDDRGFMPTVSSHGKEAPIDRSHGSSLTLPSPPPPPESEASVHELEEAQAHELGVCCRFPKGRCSCGTDCKRSHAQGGRTPNRRHPCFRPPSSGAGSVSAPPSVPPQDEGPTCRGEDAEQCCDWGAHIALGSQTPRCDFSSFH